MEHLKTKLIEIAKYYQPLGYDVPTLVEQVVRDILEDRAVADLRSRLASLTELELQSIADLAFEYGKPTPNGHVKKPKKRSPKLNG